MKMQKHSSRHSEKEQKSQVSSMAILLHTVGATHVFSYAELSEMDYWTFRTSERWITERLLYIKICIFNTNEIQQSGKGHKVRDASRHLLHGDQVNQILVQTNKCQESV